MGSPKVLTEDAKFRLADLQRLRAIEQEVRAAAKAEAQALIAERTADAMADLGQGVRDALAAGVPKRRVHQEGLGTTDFLTVDRLASLPPRAA